MRDPSEFRERFKAYKDGKSVREIYGLPGYYDGKVAEEVSDDTYRFIRKHEGFAKTLTPDPGNGLMFIGSGLSGKKYIDAFKAKGVWTEVDNMRAIKEVVRQNRSYIRAIFGERYNHLTDDQKKVIDDIAFNIGVGNLTKEKAPKFVAAVLAGDDVTAKKEINWGDKLKDIYGNPLTGVLNRNIERRMLWGGRNSMPEWKAHHIISKSDVTRVATTIPQEKTIPIIDPRNATIAEAERAMWAHNAMKDMKGAYQIPIWESPSLPSLTPVGYDVTPMRYKNGKLPGYKDGTKMLWDADAGVWRQIMDDPYADVFNNLVVTPKYIRPKFEYETNPNYQQPDKNEVVKPDETLFTRQQVEKANNTRTWRSNVADAMKYVQYASDAAGLLYGTAPGIKQRAAKAIYRNIVPASYKDSYLPGGKKQEVINAVKDFFTPKKLDLDNNAYRKWEQENLSLFFTDTDPVAARDEIYRKYLGLPNDDFYYIKNADGTYNHNLTNHEPHDIVTIINNTYNNDKGLSGKNQALPDMLNSAGGWVNTSLKKVNDVLARFKYNDVWDVNPFQDANRVGNVFPKKLLNKYSHIEKLANGEEVRVWNKDVPWFIKKLQNFELSDLTNGAPVPVKTDINVRLLNPEEYSYTKKLTDAQIIDKMKQLDLSDAYDLYGDAMSDGIISEADWNEIELHIADKVHDTFYKDPNKYRKMFVYKVNHPLKKLFDWYGPFVLLRGYKDGKISIKPANRGKFNATKKRTGKTTEELTHSKNPLTRKRAIFAQNARKWNHK